jgi:hypothetical protein
MSFCLGQDVTGYLSLETSERRDDSKVLCIEFFYSKQC